MRFRSALDDAGQCWTALLGFAVAQLRGFAVPQFAAMRFGSLAASRLLADALPLPCSLATTLPRYPAAIWLDSFAVSRSRCLRTFHR